MHVQGLKGLSSGRSPAAWNVFLAATKYACLRNTAASSRGAVSAVSSFNLFVCWYRAAVQWTMLYGRSIMGAYVPGGFHKDMQGKYSRR